MDDARIEKHTGLRTMDGEAVEHGTELERGEFRLRRMDAGNAETVLRRERGNDAHTESSHGSHGLKVGLYAGSAAGIGTCYGEYVRGLKHGTFLFV